MTEDLKKRAEQIVAARDRCKTDKLYLAEVLGYDFVKEVHEELFDLYIKYDPSKTWAFQTETRKRLILWPRGHYKTTSIIVEIVQIILNFPDIRILIMQGSKNVTQNFLHEIRCHFTGENSKSRLRELFPEFCADKMGNADHFTVPARKNKGLAQATVTIASARSVKTGQHYDIGFFDDLVNDQNYRSIKLLQKVKQDFMMCMPLIDPPFYAYVTGTRYAFGDLYEEIIRYNTNKEWTVSVKTCWLAPGIVRFPQQLSRDGQKYIGFTPEGLKAMMDSDPEMFASQYLNQPIQRGGQQFPKELMEKALIEPKLAPPLSESVLFVDLASTDSIQSDDSVIVCGKHDLLMNQYVVDVRGDRWLPPAFAQNVIEMALKHRPTRILFEKTASCIYFVDYLRLVARQHGIFLPIDFIKVDNRPDAKAIRIGSLASFLRGGKLKFFTTLRDPYRDPAAQEKKSGCWDKIVDQFGKWAPGKANNDHDDYPDTIGHMARTFGGEALAQPMRRPIGNPILEMMRQREQDTAHIMDEEAPDDGGEGFLAF